MDRYSEWMLAAVDSARLAAEHADVPVAALVFDASGELIGSARNERELRQDPTAHAEILALRVAASHTGDWHLTGTTLVVTLEPCPMCAGAILAARVPTVVFGAWDEKAAPPGRSTTSFVTVGCRIVQRFSQGSRPTRVPPCCESSSEDNRVDRTETSPAQHPRRLCTSGGMTRMQVATSAQSARGSTRVQAFTSRGVL